MIDPIHCNDELEFIPVVCPLKSKTS